MARNENKDGRKTVLLLILVIFLVLAIGLTVLLLVLKQLRSEKPGRQDTVPNPSVPVDSFPDPSESGKPAPSDSVETGNVPTDTPVPTTAETEPVLADNPINFEELQAINTDAYAWIMIPMGKEEWDIDLPILHPHGSDDDNFYLHHNLQRKYEYTGCLYTQRWNSIDFQDPVTVIYGHNMYDDSTEMFSKLVCFQDERFFEEHEFFYIYTPGHKLTYRIASAIQFDNRHILNSFDFSDETVFENWIQNYIRYPKTMIRQVREDMTVTTDDKLVILSTCLGRNMSAYRYLVQGVLISDEPTK